MLLFIKILKFFNSFQVQFILGLNVIDHQISVADHHKKTMICTKKEV